MQMYKVKLDIFEGPFDLLVYLIESAEMSIYDIQISQITSQYLEYLEQMKESAINVSQDFMVLAAELLEIKSKMLLPKAAPVDEEMGTYEEDPRTQLVEKILEYKKYKMASQLLERLEEEKLRSYEKPMEDLSRYTREPEEHLNIDLRSFVKAFDLFLRKKKKIEDVRKHYTRVERQRQSIEMKIENIISFFREKALKRVTFSQLLKDRKDRYDVVLTFTSMLQMIRDRLVTVDQKHAFGEMSIELSGEGESHDN